MGVVSKGNRWWEEIYEIDIDTPVKGGAPSFDGYEATDGWSNASAKQLSDRTNYLFEKVPVNNLELTEGALQKAGNLSDLEDKHEARVALSLDNVDNTSDANKPVSSATQQSLDTKVDKADGKELSTNDFTDAEKSKLNGIASGATANQPELYPTIDLNFAKGVYSIDDGTRTFGPGEDLLTVERATPKWVTGPNGKLREVPPDTLAREWRDGKPQGLLIEEQRTNEYKDSQNFGSSNWAYDSAGYTVTPDDGPELIEGKNADLVTFNEVGARLSQLYSGDFTRANSFAVRYVSGSEIVSVYTRNQRAEFDIVTGTVLSGNGFIKYLGKGFYLCTLAGTNDSSRAALRSDFGSYHVAYAQLEQGSTPSSYIKTEGTQVTRAADNVSRELRDEFNGSEFTVLCDLDSERIGTLASGVLLYTSELSSTYRAWIYFSENGGGVQFITNDGTGTKSIVSQSLPDTRRRIAVSFAGSFATLAVNGVIEGSGQVAVPPNISNMLVGRTANNSDPLNGSVKETCIYPRVLSEAELIALTTPEA